MKPYIRFFIPLLVMGILSACGGGADISQTEELQATEYYQITYREFGKPAFIVDRDGNEISEEDIIYPMEALSSTEESAYYYQWRYTYETREEEGQEYLEEIRYMRMLDAQENIVIDWSRDYINEFIGDLVMRMDYETYDNFVYNFKTGETVLKNVYSYEGFKDKLLVTANSGNEMYLLDGRGNILQELNNDEGKLYAWIDTYNEDYILAGYFSNDKYEDRGDMILDEEFNILYDYKDIFHSDHIAEGYLVYRDDENQGYIIADFQGNKIFESGEGKSISYFDGKIIITQYSTADSGYGYRYDFCDVSGTVIFPRCNEIINLPDKDGKPSDQFIIHKESTLFVSDSKGNITVSKEFSDNLYIDIQKQGIISVTYRNEDTEMLLDYNLDYLIEPDIYRYISPDSYNDFNNRYFLCRQKSIGLTDIWDSETDTFIKDLGEVRTIKDDRIVARKGYYKGLMDMQGNWIAKISIFDEIEM